MLNLDGLVVCVQMQRDDSAAHILSIYWGRDINIAILAHGQVPHRAQTFSHDTRVKARWKAQRVRLLSAKLNPDANTKAKAAQSFFIS